MTRVSVLSVLIIGLLSYAGTSMAQMRTGASSQKSIVVIYNDGHRQSIPMNVVARIEFAPDAVVVFKDGHQQRIADDIQRIEFSPASNESGVGRNYFVGRWKVGVDQGGATFFITLEPNGEAHKSLGASHGTWALIDGEARISWDDGWHDAIRKVGSKHEKLAYEPGKTFSDTPSNVTDAKNLTAQPI